MGPKATMTSKLFPAPCRARALLLTALLASLCSGCGEATPPATMSVATLRGSPYERGFQHGQRFASQIRSFYTGLLTSSLLPYLNRERPDLAGFLLEYRGSKYDGGQFSYQLMLESALHMEPSIAPELLEEMHGIADGARLPYDDVLVLNTFLDTLLGFRAMTFFLRKIQSPEVVSVEFTGGLESDGLDNDGDGAIDEEGEAVVQPYSSEPFALMAEVPTDGEVLLRVRDRALIGSPEGVDPDSLRIQLDETVYYSGHPSISTQAIVVDDEPLLEVRFTPPEELSAAEVHSLLVHAADQAWVTDPPPAHARIMRGERFSFSTVGYGKPAYEIDNRGHWDGFSMPPSLSFALRGSATRDGRPLLAHHFAMLDSNVTHKHTVLFIHLPDDGGIPHAVVGWTGVLGGFTGLNAAGLGYAVNNSDTLDTPMVARVVEELVAAKLLSSGAPATMMGRQILASQSSVDETLDYLRQVQQSNGWNILLADQSGAIVAVEVDGDATGDGDGGLFAFSPDDGDPANLDPHGRRWSSVGPDDLRMAAHYRINTEDVDAQVLDWAVTPQRTWTSYYHRSLRAYYNLGDRLARDYGSYDLDQAIATLRDPNLVDTRDSMNAAVLLPADRLLYCAMGQVPATDGPFVRFDLSAVASAP